MSQGNSLLVPSLSVSLLVLASCGGGGSDGSGVLQVQSVVQDLDLDPDGTTTVIEFDRAVTTLTVSNFATDAEATPTAVTLDGEFATVVWSARVGPASQVSLTGVAGASAHAVTTTDDSAPSYEVLAATQGEGLGADVIEIQFSGPRVDPLQVVEGGNWLLEIGSSDFPLSASDFDFDVEQQTLTITTDSTANLHADFNLRVSGLVSVADTAVSAAAEPGEASGDAVPPTLVSAEQKLAQDEFGRVVEFEFSEAMDPAFSAQLVNFTSGFLVFPTQVTQPTPEVLRVRFAAPIVPGQDTVSLFGLVDAHGNALGNGAQAIAAATTVDNDFDGDPELRTVSGVGGDQLVAVTVQALDPDTAEDPDSWELEIDGAPVALEESMLDYDLLEKTLTIALDEDVLNGVDFELVSVGAIDVDGEAFEAEFDGFADGDVVLPLLTEALQNRASDETGETLDLSFSEELEETSAELVGNYALSGGLTVTSAVLLGDASVVRLSLDGPAVPGVHTLDVSGLSDPAGNLLDAVVGAELISTDTTAPSAVSAAATGLEGLDNDRLRVVFDDLLYEDDVTDSSHWIVESPQGTALDTSSVTVSYDPDSHSATLVFDAGDGIDFQVDADFSVALSGVRDLGGNLIGAGTLTGVADVERRQPQLEAVYVRDTPFENQVVVVFDEPLAEPDAFVAADLQSSAGAFLSSAAQLDWDAETPREVVLSFGQVVTAGNQRLLFLGAQDAAGNPFLGVDQHPIAAQDDQEPALDGGSSALLATSGEGNDVLTLVLDRRPSRLGLLELERYTVIFGGDEQDLSGAELDFDGDLTVTVTLAGELALATGGSYTVEIDGIESAQGVAMSAADSAVVMASGDLVQPSLVAGRVRLDPADSAHSLVVEFSEALDADDLEDASLYQIGLTPADSATRLGPLSARVTFDGGVAVSDVLEVTARDQAGNVGLMSAAVTAADTVGPLVATVEAEAVSGAGGDLLWVTFNEPLAAHTALVPGPYTLTVDGSPVDLSSAQFGYSSLGNRVRIELPAGTEFDVLGTVAVTIEGIEDVSGNAMSLPANLAAMLGGDSQAPDFRGACVDLRSSAAGDVVLVAFDEAVDPLQLDSTAVYSVSGGQTVTAVEVLTDDTVRLTLSAALGADDLIEVDALRDLAQNASGALAIDPLE
jgi:hypothetical protein